MTTILFTNDHIYCDTQVSDSGSVLSVDAIKFHPMSNGNLAFGSGCVCSIAAMIATREKVKGRDFTKYIMKAIDSTLVVAQPDGYLEVFHSRDMRCDRRHGPDAGNGEGGLFWYGLKSFKAIGSGRQHIDNYMKYVGSDPIQAMRNAALSDTATSDRFFKIPRRWEQNKPLKVEFYNGFKSNGEPRTPITIEVEFPTSNNWIYDVFTGKRSLTKIDLKQLTKHEM